MSLDYPAMLEEAMRLISALQQRVLGLAGENGALKNELSEIKKKVESYEQRERPAS